MRISLSVIKDRNSRQLFAGQLISQACDKMMSVGLIWMFAERGLVEMMPWFVGLSALPHLLLAWRAGHWAVRLGPIRTLVVTDVLRGIIYVLLGLAWTGIQPGLQIPALLVATVIAGAASSLFNPAVMSVPTLLAEGSSLQQLTAWIESCFSLGNVIGPLLSAVFYSWMGLRGLFLVNGLSYLLAAFMESSIRPAKAYATQDGGEPVQSPSLLHILRGDQLVTLLLVSFLASNLFLGPLMVFLPLFAKSAFQGSIDTLAVLEGVFGLGTVAGALLLSTIDLGSGQGRRKIVATLLAVSVCYVAFTLSTNFWIGATCMGLLGLSLALTNVLSMTLFQTRLQPEGVPVLMSLVNLISVASLPLSMAALGLVLNKYDVRHEALFCSCGLCVITLVVISRPSLRLASGPVRRESLTNGSQK